jgi:GDP-D-mannose 3',5'-epimerase
MYIDDCLEGTKKIFNSELTDVYNLGSDEQVSINQMIDMIEEIAGYKVKRKYLLDKPKGVRGRSSDNNKIKSDLKWAPSISLVNGLTKTYKWIDDQLKSGENTLKFIKS